MAQTTARAALIAALNDGFRTTGKGGRMMMTAGIDALPEAARAMIVKKVMEFEEFNGSNDPYKEHDFGSIWQDGEKLFWKIDYYDNALEGGSEDPADPRVTQRVLTIMLASEY